MEIVLSMSVLEIAVSVTDVLSILKDLEPYRESRTLFASKS